MTETEAIVEVIEALGGVERVADELQASRHSVQRWRTGQNPIPPGVWQEFVEAIDRRLTIGRVRTVLPTAAGQRAAWRAKRLVELRAEAAGWATAKSAPAKAEKDFERVTSLPEHLSDWNRE